MVFYATIVFLDSCTLLPRPSTYLILNSVI